MSTPTVASRLGQALERAGISQSELAKRLGTKQSTVHGWVKQGVPPTADLLAKVPKALGINGHWLLTGEGQMDPPKEAVDLEAERRAVRAEFAARLESAVAATIREVTAQASGQIVIGGSATASESATPRPAPDEEAIARGRAAMMVVEAQRAASQTQSPAEAPQPPQGQAAPAKAGRTRKRSG